MKQITCIFLCKKISFHEFCMSHAIFRMLIYYAWKLPFNGRAWYKQLCKDITSYCHLFVLLLLLLLSCLFLLFSVDEFVVVVFHVPVVVAVFIVAIAGVTRSDFLIIVEYFFFFFYYDYRWFEYLFFFFFIYNFRRIYSFYWLVLFWV